MSITVSNGGEAITFLAVHEDEKGPYLHVRSVIEPGGPPVRAHDRKDQGLTVEHGTLGYQRAGEEPQTAGPGEHIVFRAGQVHRYWNAGDDVLECDGWIAVA